MRDPAHLHSVALFRATAGVILLCWVACMIALGSWADAKREEARAAQLALRHPPGVKP